VDDAALVGAARRGEEAALAELLERHRPRVRALAHSLLRDWNEAEDLAQEVLLSAHVGLDGLRDPARFGAWLRGITINLAKMRIRRLAREPVPDAGGGASVPAPAGDSFADGIELLELVRQALETLAPAEREVVYLHHVADLSCAEIAERLGDTPGAVRVRLHRARARLRQPLSAARAARKETTMVEVELQDVIVRAVDEDGATRLANPSRIVLLREGAGDRVLPIWVGAGEGDALALHRAAEVLPRPLTADLMARLVEAAGARVERITVTRLEDRTFYAVVVLAGGAELDARPSDALNLAVRVGARVEVDPAVFAEAAVPRAELHEKLETETAKHFGGPLAGEWRSLTPELVQSFWPAWPRSEAEEGR
jgi:RNA polymerase sigma factor (sigma-70 family)